MALRLYQQSFNGGVMSPEMYGRAADVKYQSGLAKCTNFLIDPRGPAVARPGFVHVNSTKYDDKKARLIPFTFSTTQSLVLEFGEKYIRFHTEGQTVLKSDGTPYEISTPYSASEVFDIHYVQQADIVTLVHPNHPPKELKRYGATDWRLETISFTSPLSAPAAPTVVQSINKEVSNPTDYTRKYAVTALLTDGTGESSLGASTSIKCNPYGTGAYNTISWSAVSGAGLYRVYRDQGGIWAYIGQTNELSIVDENISPDLSITPPNYDDPFYLTKGITSVSVTAGGSGYYAEGSLAQKSNFDFVITGQNPPEVPTFRIYDATGSGTGAQGTLIYTRSTETGTKRWRENSNNDGTISYTYHVLRVTGISFTSTGTNYSSPKIELVGKNEYVYPDSSRSITWLKNLITETYSLTVEKRSPAVSVSDSTGSGAVLKAVVSNGTIAAINVVSGGSNYSNPTIVISSSAGSGASATASIGKAGDYPGAVSYFEQRRWFGGTVSRPNNIWATRSGTEADMSYSLPTQDTDRIAVRVAAREANRILHFIPLSHLILLTGAAEWRVSPLNNDAITPSSMSVRPQSYVGANNVQPVVVNNSALYAANRGGHLRECGYSYEAGGFITNDVCVRSNHLFDNLDIYDLAYAKAPFPIVWAVSSAGNLIAFTYIPEQQVGGFSTVETQGVFESCAVVSESEEDALYVVVRRNINGQTKRFVEKLHQIKFTSLAETMRLDCAGTYRGEAKKEISGLDWLEGETVSILADGGVEPPQKVVNGKITLEKEASLVHIGLPFNSDMQSLPLSVSGLPDGSYASGHKKNVKGVELRVVNSSGFSAGPSFEKLSDYPARSTEFAGSPPDPSTGAIGVEVRPQWSRDGQVCIRQSNPLPLKVISLTSVVEIV